MFTFLIAIAQAATISVVGNQVLVDGTAIVTLSSPPLNAIETDGRLWVLRSDQVVEVWQLSPSPQQIGGFAAPGAIGLFVTNGKGWIEVTETRAMPLSTAALNPLNLPAQTAPLPTAPPPPLTEVTEVAPGLAILNQGKSGGFTVGTALRFLGERNGSEEQTGTGVVVRATADRTEVELVRGSAPQVGDHVERIAVLNSYPMAPERLPLTEFGAILRPFLALNTVGLGSANEFWATKVFDAPWYANARLSPLALGGSQNGMILNLTGSLSGGYETQYFSVGLGAGVSTLGPGAFDTGVNNQDIPGAALAILQEARLGARDGIHIGVRNQFLLVPNIRCNYNYSADTNTCTTNGSEFSYGGINLDLAVPTGLHTDLFGAFTFSDVGVIVAEGGVSTWLRGNGAPGSLGLRVGAGYGRQESFNNASALYGPMISVGIQYRLP